MSPDGKRFAVVVNNRGSQNLALLAFEKGEPKLEIIPLSPPFEKGGPGGLRVSTPRWSPDGNFIVYSVTSNDGKSSLYLYNIKEKTHKQLFEEVGSNGYPTWSRDGRYIIYTSDKTNVYNLFAYSMGEGRRYQVARFSPMFLLTEKILFFPVTIPGVLKLQEWNIILKSGCLCQALQ